MALKLISNSEYQWPTTRKAHSALSKHTFVKSYASDDAQCDPASSGSDDIIGVVEYAYDAGEIASVIEDGVCIVYAGEAISRGDKITAGASGYAYKAGDDDNAVAVAVNSCAAAGTLISIKLCVTDQGERKAARKVAVINWTYASTVTGSEGDETGTGWSFPTSAIVNGVWVRVNTAEATGATKTVDIGTLSTASGDADGFLDGVSVSATGMVKGTLASAGQTLGALLYADEDGAGALVPEASVACGGKQISVTLGSADFAELDMDIIVDYTEIA